ncbi:peptidylprolyl isomerase [Candidatus Pelagibacter sp. HIMB1748]|uniref:peptidylprolyl isomerase n=1 Tax=unclassified Candidatus Pelagibacter TaxID=2647897 RepID=UPI003F87B354
MKKIIKLILILCFSLVLLATNKTFASKNKIILKVENSIITSVDILNEIKYLSLLNKNLDKLDQKKKIEIAKNSLIKEKVKSIILSRYFKNFDLDQKYYENLINDFAKRINIESHEELKIFLKKRNLKFNEIEKKIKLEIMWNQLILSKFSKDVKVNIDEIRQDVLRSNIQREYLISEILFSIKENEKIKLKLDKIKKDVKESSFENAALIHSISNSANNGGKLGWIKENSLSNKIKIELSKISKGDYTDPIVIPGGFLILKINEVREIKIKNNIDDEIKIISKEIANKQLNQFSSIFYNKTIKNIQINEL